MSRCTKLGALGSFQPLPLSTPDTPVGSRRRRRVGRDGLPVGVQIIGGYLEDKITVALAGLIEREFGGFTPPPTLL